MLDLTDFRHFVVANTLRNNNKAPLKITTTSVIIIGKNPLTVFIHVLKCVSYS